MRRSGICLSRDVSPGWDWADTAITGWGCDLRSGDLSDWAVGERGVAELKGVEGPFCGVLSPPVSLGERAEMGVLLSPLVVRAG